MQQRTRGMVEMVAAMVIAGTIGWLVVVAGRPVREVVFWRCLFGALALLPVCLALGHLRPGRITARQALLAAVGGLAIVGNWVLLFEAYADASIGIATAVYNTQPFMLVLLGALFLGERVTLRALGWLALAFGGMVLIVQSRPGAHQPGGDYLVGIVLALGAAFLYALAALLAKRLHGVPPHLIALIHVGVGSVALAPWALQAPWPQDAGTWQALVTLGVVHTALMYVLLYGAIQRLPTHLTGALSFVYPIMAIVVDRLVFGHLLAPLQLLGAALILLAAGGMTTGLAWPRRRAAASPSSTC